MNIQPKPKVLVVDNNDETLRHLAAQLTAAGYDAETTWSGWDALNRLQSAEFGFLILDEYLPDLYIGEFFLKLSQSGSAPHVLLMQENPAKPMKFPGSRKCAVVNKTQIDQILRELSEHQRTQAFKLQKIRKQ